MTSAAYWLTYDLSGVSATAKGYQGAAFDGRYVYLAPFTHGSKYDGLTTRYDTQMSFDTPTSWTTFDTATVSAEAQGFSGAVFDGRYVYLVPNNNGSPDGLVARYDTTETFTTGTSWSTFDVTTVDTGAVGYSGGAFDGRYIYLVPSIENASGGLVVRYDTQGTFSTSTSWAKFDATMLSAQVAGYQGALYDGKYVYFVPAGAGTTSALVLRFDVTAIFEDASSWSTFDTTTLSSSAKGFAGGAFDGRYVYLTPYSNGDSYDGVVVRYDSEASFATASSWSMFDLTTVNQAAKGFGSAAFDGRFVYFVPYADATSGVSPTYDGVVARYDTLADFASTTSWSTFDTTTLNSGAAGFTGAAFDGRYLYLVPDYNGQYVAPARPQQQLHLRATAIQEQKDVPTQRIQTDDRSHLVGQSLEGLAQVRRLPRCVDPHRPRKKHHRRRARVLNARITVATHCADAASAALTSMRVPLSVVSTTAGPLLVTSTGTKRPALRPNLLRHQSNRCGTMPTRPANAATLSPLASITSSASRASCSVHGRFVPRRATRRSAAVLPIVASRLARVAAGPDPRRWRPARQGTVWRTDTPLRPTLILADGASAPAAARRHRDGAGPRVQQGLGLGNRRGLIGCVVGVDGTRFERRRRGPGDLPVVAG
jgi:hypothetical protein